MIFKRLFIAIWLLLCIGDLAWADSCKDCHRKTWSEGIKKSYIHPPFLEEKCKICHIYKNMEDKEDSKTIVKTTPIAYEHEITIALKEDTKYRALIRVRDKKGKIKELTRILDINQLSIERDETPPRIFNVRVEQITPGVFFEAVIVWDTDEPSTSQVEYGTPPHYGFITPLDENLVTHHVVKIANLGKGEVYHFRVHSADLYGNEAVSADMTFKVKPQTSSKKTFQAQTVSDLEIRDLHIFKTPDNRVVFFWLTTKPAQGTVEVKEITQASTQLKGHDNFVIKGEKEAGFKACYKCHSSEKLGISHPVGVPLTSDMHAPSDLPLPDGMVTCSSCHQPHGSEYRYILRKPMGRELCVSCHGERY